MALINCPECGKEISDKAQKCIHCGCPVATEKEPQKSINISKPDINVNEVKDKVKNIVATIGIKKLGIIAGAIAVVIILISLFSGGITSSAKEIKLNEVYEINGVGELEILRVSTTNHLLEQEPNGKSYIVFDCYFTNKTASAYSICEFANISAKSKKTGAVYSNSEVGTIGLANVIGGIKAEPNMKTKVSFVLEIPEDEGDVVVSLGFGVGKKSIDFKYTVGDLIRNAEPFSAGSKIEVEDIAGIEFTNIVYSNGIWAPNPYSGRTHRGYRVDDADETAYLIVDTMYTNLMNVNQDPEDRGDGPVKVEVGYQNKYYYTSSNFYCFEYDGKYITNTRYETNDFIPNSTIRTCIVVEVPKSMIEDDVEIIIFVGDKEFTYTGTPSYTDNYGVY